jgi:hypothetical protein
MEEMEKLLAAAFVTAIFTAIVAVRDVIGGKTIFLSDTPRIMSTLNNPNFYGSYLLLIIFLSASFAFVTTQKVWRYIVGGTVIVQVLALVLTYSRGADLSLYTNERIG